MAETFNRTIDQLGTTNTKIYTCPANTTATICFMQAANVDFYNVTNNQVTVMVSSSDDSGFYLAKDMVVASRQSVSPISGELLLTSNQEIWAYASQSGSPKFIHLVIGMIERS